MSHASERCRGDRLPDKRAVGSAVLAIAVLLPAIHLMGYYRKRLGHWPGELQVCEDVAARSLVLSFLSGG